MKRPTWRRTHRPKAYREGDAKEAARLRAASQRLRELAELADTDSYADAYYLRGEAARLEADAIRLEAL